MMISVGSIKTPRKALKLGLGCTPLTKSTFDAGVVGVDANMMGVLVVQVDDLVAGD
jgi:hypothetical protein